MEFSGFSRQARDLSIAAFVAFIFGLGAVVALASIMPSVLAAQSGGNLNATHGNVAASNQ